MKKVCQDKCNQPDIGIFYGITLTGDHKGGGGLIDQTMDVTDVNMAKRILFSI